MYIGKVKYSFFDLVFFLNMLFIGADKLAFSISGFNIRVVQLLLLATGMVFIATKKLRLRNMLLFIPFFVINLLSTLNSYDIKSSVAYTLWTLYNFLFVFCLFYSWASELNGDKVYRIWRLTFVIQGIYLVAQFIVGLFGLRDPFFGTDVYKGIPRPAVWFYEPSYIATYFSVFFSMAIYLYLNTKEKRYRRDMILAIIFILLITSTTGYLAIGVSIVLCLIFSGQLRLADKMKYGTQLLILACIGFAGLYLVYPKVITVFIGRLFTEGVVNASGDRIRGWKAAFDVFMDYPVLGIGPNAFQHYTDTGVPPTNVTLELLSNLGAVGLTAFCIFFIGVVVRGYHCLKRVSTDEAVMARAMIFAFVIFMIILQANQNYLRIYMWMHLGLLAGISVKAGKAVGKKITGEKGVAG